MTKLEPTRTSSDLTATEQLRRMLDERRVEHVDEKDGKFLLVTWSYNETSATFVEDTVSGETSIAISAIVSPDQAIAATLGSCNCSNSERTGTCLPHFWTHDRALHIEATRMPTRIVVCEGGTCEFVPKRELDTSEAENAKLRELTRAAWRCIHTGASCSDCRLIAGGCTLQTAMRELGVEV